MLAAAAAELVASMPAGEFHNPHHEHIAAAIRQLHADNQPIDPTTVDDELRRQGLADDVGGEPALIALQSATPAATSAGRYAHIVQRDAASRRQLARSVDLDTAARNGDFPAMTAIIDEAQAENDRATNRTGPVPMSQLKTEWLDIMDARVGGVGGGIPTGFADLDTLIGGLQPGQLIIVAGRTSMGKSAFAGSLALNIAADGNPLVVCSVEMSRVELMDRWVGIRARVDVTGIQRGTIARNDWLRVAPALDDFDTLPIDVDDNPAMTLAEVRQAARANNATVVIVDYLQLLRSTARRENRQIEVAELSTGLKRLARQLRIPVVALAQLNRSPEQRRDRRPMLADLRESGAIEMDADVVIGLYRDEIYNHDTKDSGVLEAIVLKQRSGPIGVARLAYLKQFTAVENMVRF